MTWSTALRLGRVSNLPTVWSNTIVGAAIAGAAVPSPRLGLVLVSLSLFYTGGMYLNDAFDTDVDTVERPERPIPSGEVSASLVFAGGYVMLAVAALMLVLAASATTRAATAAAALALAAAIVWYNADHKANALAPLAMASCRTLVYLSAALALSGSALEMLASPRLWLAATGLACYVAGLTATAAGENTGTTPRPWPLALLAVAPMCAVVLARGDTMALGLLATLIVWMAYSLALLLRRNNPSIGAAVVRLIAGISLFDAIVVAAIGEPHTAIIVAAGLPLTRLLQGRISGT